MRISLNLLHILLVDVNKKKQEQGICKIDIGWFPVQMTQV